MVVALNQSGMISQRSSYIKHLPAIYADSDFMGRFLMVFETIMGPLEGVVDNLAYYFDPGTTPEEFLPWLATWVDLVLDESWPMERRRDLVRSAVHIYRWRGTRRGMKEYLRVYTGIEPEIAEGHGGIPLGGGSRLGWTTVLGSGAHHTFTVTLRLDDPDALNLSHIKAIIEAEKPAHTAYRLRVLPRDGQPQDAPPSDAEDAAADQAAQ